MILHKLTHVYMHFDKHSFQYIHFKSFRELLHRMNYIRMVVVLAYRGVVG